MESNFTILVDKIKILSNTTKIEKIKKGYSPDEKYIIVDENEKKYLLRISDMAKYARRIEEFQIINVIKKHQVHAPQRIDISILKELGICYTIFSYIEGEDAKQSLPTLTE